MIQKPVDVIGLGRKAEAERLVLITGLINKRKDVRDLAISKLDDLILYCDRKILDIGDEDIIRADFTRQQMAAPWQKSIMEFEKQIVVEQKEHFRDTLFLQNEWIKSLQNYQEEKRLDDLMKKIISK
jgi:hypothetical protein